jgi:Na+/H+ antiporter NhaD/arsenite permease-like protein
MPDDISSWFSQPAVMWGVGIFSVVAVVATIILVPRYVASLPADYLRGGERNKNPSVPLRIARNALGVLLVLLGIAMLLLPGQGVITLLVGVLLVDFPGKQKLIQRVLGRPKILKAVNKLRARHDAPPLVA